MRTTSEKEKVRSAAASMAYARVRGGEDPELTEAAVRRYLTVRRYVFEPSADIERDLDREAADAVRMACARLHGFAGGGEP